MRKILGITVLQFSIVLCTSLYTFTVLTGVNFISSNPELRSSRIEDFARYCGERDACDGFTFERSVDDSAYECQIFRESNSYIYYINTSSLYVKSKTCGDVINASNYMQAWTEWVYSNCTDDCGMYGLQNRTRTWQPPSDTYKSIYGLKVELNIPCPAMPLCLFPRFSCADGFVHIFRKISNTTVVLCQPNSSTSG